MRHPRHSLPAPGEASITTQSNLLTRSPVLPEPSAGPPGRRWKPLAAVLAAWTAGRVLLLVAALGLLGGADVSSDVKVIYQGWAEVLGIGTFPLDDVTWQYPPLAALVMVLPSWLPWSYFTGFLVLVVVCDAAVTGLLLRAARPGSGGSRAGVWMWVLAVPLLGPTVYCRFDLVVTSVAVAGLLAGAARPRLGGALAGAGALLKVWPALILIGVPRGRRTRDAWTAAVVSALAIGFWYAVTMVGGFSFLGFQAGRGVEIESLGALPFYLAHWCGWSGRAAMHYGSSEFLGSGVPEVGQGLVLCTAAAFGWLLLWRVRADRWTAATPYDAALTALLLFTVTSRVISPQYLVWLIGTAAVCLSSPGTVMRPVARLLAAAGLCTYLEFPLLFGQLATFRPLGVGALFARDLLLLAAALLAARRLWRGSVVERRLGAGRLAGRLSAGRWPRVRRRAGPNATAP